MAPAPNGAGAHLTWKNMKQCWNQILPLAMLPPGEQARIVSLEREGEAGRRLVDMGLSLGSKVEVLVAGNNTPLLVACGQTRLAIEPDLARSIMVVRLPSPRRHRRRRGLGWRMR